MRLCRLAAILLGASAPAQAGVFTDDLSRCLVEKSSDADRTAFMRWMFAALTRDPALADLAQVSEARRDRINRTAADIYGRLIFLDCRPEAVAALKNEGLNALGPAGQALGGAAARRLLGSPAGQAELRKFGELTDPQKWEALVREAGISAADK